jgi:hypothetical protein
MRRISCAGNAAQQATSVIWPGFPALRVVEFLEAGIGIGQQEAREGPEMLA